jgi:uncharacterized protein (DUF3084 family)
MCAVSVILDYGRQMPMDNWNHQKWRDFQTLKQQAEEFDSKTDQPDCEDPAKAEWMREVEERLARLENP